MMEPARPAHTYAFALLAAAALALLPRAADALPKCLFISSYHQGYAWSDGVERGLRSILSGQCELKQFDMDTKQHKSIEHKRSSAERARALIASWAPDIVITADDNAAKYVIQAHFKDAAIPFVFSGVNWTVKEYGFPYSNVTGMIEVAPIEAMLERAIVMADGGRTAFYLGADTLTERKNLHRFKQAAANLNLQLTHALVPTLATWGDALNEAQSADFVIMGSNSGITDWDQARAEALARQSSKRLSITNHGWMMPYAMFGMTKVPEEQGEWSAKAALAILAGTSPADIPIVANRKWDVWINEVLLHDANVHVPPELRHRAKRYQR